VLREYSGAPSRSLDVRAEVREGVGGGKSGNSFNVRCLEAQEPSEPQHPNTARPQHRPQKEESGKTALP